MENRGGIYPTKNPLELETRKKFKNKKGHHIEVTLVTIQGGVAKKLA